MPTYEYQCKQGHHFEYFQSMNDKPLSRCKKCGQSVTRLMGSGLGILFKGSGFYETDYKRPSKPSGSSASGSTSDTPKQSTDTKSSSQQKKDS